MSQGSRIARLSSSGARLAPHEHLTARRAPAPNGPVVLVCTLLARTCGDLSGARERAERARALATRLEAELFVRESDEVLASLEGARP